MDVKKRHHAFMGATDSRLVERVLQGDVDAFGILITRYQKKVFNIMYRVNLSREDAADLTQEAFCRAFEKLNTFRTDGNFYPWLCSIALNIARDNGRKKFTHAQKISEISETLSHNDSMTPQDDALSKNRSVRALYRALSQLPLEYREAIILRYRDEFSMREIALILHISESAAKMRVHRALTKLQEILGEEIHG